MRILSWTKASIADLTNIRHWLVNEASTSIAIRLLTQIRQQASKLEAFPALGTTVTATERKLRVRGTNYVILYRIRPDSVEVLRVRHNRQDWRPHE